MDIDDGAKVCFCGYPRDGLAIGDRGLVMQAGNTGSHVRWVSGARAGVMELVANHDLAPDIPEWDPFESLGVGRLVTVAVRQIHDHGGDAALVRVLGEEGYLPSSNQLGQIAMESAIEALRENTAMAEVVADLEPEDGETFLRLAAFALLREALLS